MRIESFDVIPITCHSGARRGIIKITSDEGVTGYGEMGEAATWGLG